MFGVSRHDVLAFVYGLVSSVVWFAPVLWLFGLTALNGYIIIPAILFTIFWVWLWTAFANKHHFYTRSIIWYSVGSALGIVLTLTYTAFFDGLIRGLF